MVDKDKIIQDYKADLKRAVPTVDVAFVGNLLGDVFGVESPVYLSTWWRDRNYEADAYIVDTMNEEADDGSPVRYGKKTFGAFWLEAGNYFMYDAYTNKLSKQKFNNFLMPLGTLVYFNRSKIVVKTETIGAGGSVKEIYGFSDWQISIKGVIVPDAVREGFDATVDGQMAMLQSFDEIADSIRVRGAVFAKRKISRIVIESLQFEPIQGYPNMMQYSIDAVSDNDILEEL